MRIKKMTASFGALEKARLEPGPGLTVITAPNEAGKSTWAGFLKAMLYGIDTRERDKTGFLADKNRYQPWSGVSMAGELQAEWQGRDVTLRRFPSKSNPFGGFEAVYTATGDSVPGLTAANVGEKLTGAGREVFLRSAFVGQGGAAITPSGELETRISALATSGEEDVSYSVVERTLKDWRNRRRSNRSNGLIPQMEEERAALVQTLREMEQASRRKESAQRELAALREERDELQGELEIWQRIERHELNRRYGEAYLEWENAKANIPEDAPHPLFGTMTGEEAWAFSQKKQQERDTALEENRRREAERGRIEASWHKYRNGVGLFAGILAVLLLLGLIIAVWNGNWVSAFAGTGTTVLLALVFLIISPRIRKNVRQRLKELSPVHVPQKEDWLAQAARYREDLAKAQQAKLAEASARRRVDDLAAQGGQLFDTLELLYPPARPKAEIAARLSATERELERCQAELARIEGELAHMGSGEDAEDRLAELDGQLAARQGEYGALTAALEALSVANDALRQRFSPALNREAGKIFAALTGGRYETLSLARDFTAQTAQEGEVLPRSALTLSAGTAEQLYLAVRLAVCRLTLPDVPVLLDDALCAFDDGRVALAMDYLKTLGEERQILLFSCHSREADWAKAHNCPVIVLSS